MNSRPLLFLLPLICFTAVGSQAQTLPTLTYLQTGSGTTTLVGQLADYRDYTFNITGFSNVGADPTNDYTIFSFSNSSIEDNPDFYGITAYDLPAGWTFSDAHDFTISTSLARGIHATDPTFGLTISQKAGTPAIDFAGAPFTLYHKIDGVDPFQDTIQAEPVPEASSMISFGLLLLGGLFQVCRRGRRGSKEAA